ncbi:MAG: hypothetical protein IIA45_03770 [Bacteroidetes bacterium]|nr:hypothetical protein [Bacteroidota bacterium]
MTEMHINSEGQFQSDLHPDLKPDKIILSFKDPEARPSLRLYSENCSNRELGDNILKRLKDFDESE